jgi:hypothetical protein
MIIYSEFHVASNIEDIYWLFNIVSLIQSRVPFWWYLSIKKCYYWWNGHQYQLQTNWKLTWQATEAAVIRCRESGICGVRSMFINIQTSCFTRLVPRSITQTMQPIESLVHESEIGLWPDRATAHAWRWRIVILYNTTEGDTTVVTLSIYKRCSHINHTSKKYWCVYNAGYLN